MPLQNLEPDNTLKILEELRKARAIVASNKRAVKINPRDFIAQHLVEVWEERVKELEDQANGI